MVAMMLAMTIMSSSVTEPNLPREFRAVWVATVANIDWPSKPGLPVDQQKSELLAIVNRAAELNMNAIVFQVRPAADAMYPSKLEPWAAWLNGTQGQAPQPMWDPLAFIVDESHKRGIELHAWFNPYRAWHKIAKGSPCATHISKTHPKSVVSYDNYIWMDPSDAFVQQRTLDVMMDVVHRYDVDGIHIDDYFYPYPIRDKNKVKVPFPDSANYATYKKKGGKLDVGDWRRKQVDDMIERIYKTLKKEKKSVKFGISPFGIYRPGQPETIAAGIDQYDELYADCLKWLKKGWCDYMTPQLYWPISQTKQSYPVLLKWWKENTPANRHLWPGSYSGLVSEKWEPKEVLDQIQISRDQNAQGAVHFSMKVFMENSKGLNDALLAGPYAEKALPPASPWLAGTEEVPKPGKATATQGMGEVTVSFPAIKSANARFVVASSGDHILAIGDPKSGSLKIRMPSSSEPVVQSMQLRVMDRAGRLGLAVDVAWK